MNGGEGAKGTSHEKYGGRRTRMSKNLDTDRRMHQCS